MRRALRWVAGTVIAISAIVGASALLVICLKVAMGNFDDAAVEEIALGSSIAAILLSGIIWLLVEIADTLTAAHEHSVRSDRSARRGERLFQ